MVEWYRLNRIEWIYQAQTFFFLSFVSLVATTTTRFSNGCSKVLSCPSPFLCERRKTRADRAVCCLFVCLSSMSSIAFQSGSPCYCRVVGWLAGSSRKTLSIKCIRLSCCHQSSTNKTPKNQSSRASRMDV